MLRGLIISSLLLVAPQRATFFGHNQSLGYATYTDTFVRANGTLGYPWTEPVASSTGGDLQIIGNQVFAHGAQPGAHYFDIYTGGTFPSNQYSTTTIESVGSGGTFASQGGIVRGLASGQYYNDLVPTSTGNSGLYAIGYEDGTDFNPATPVFPGSTAYTIGDTHTLAVAGGCPVFFWSLHNGALDATGIETSRCYMTGVPGFGSVVDMNSTPIVASGPWTGGPLPALNTSTTPSDNFTRTNGFMGYNWWIQMMGGENDYTCAMTIASNKATTDSGCSTTNNGAMAVWTTPRPSLTQTSSITWGTTSVWEGPVVRLTPTADNGTQNNTYYVAIYFAGAPLLFSRDVGGFHSLPATLCSSATPTTLELDATGTNPVVLTVKINGTVCGSPYSDSTYKFAGQFIGFESVGPSTTVAGWSGS